MHSSDFVPKKRMFLGVFRVHASISVRSLLSLYLDPPPPPLVLELPALEMQTKLSPSEVTDTLTKEWIPELAKEWCGK